MSIGAMKFSAIQLQLIPGHFKIIINYPND